MHRSLILNVVHPENDSSVKNENSNVLGLKSSINGNTVLGYKKGSKIKCGIGFGSTTPILWVVSLYSFAQKSTDTWEDFRK